MNEIGSILTAADDRTVGDATRKRSGSLVESPRFRSTIGREESMRKLIVAEFISLDGVIQSPGGPEEDPADGFRFGGWVSPFAKPRCSGLRRSPGRVDARRSSASSSTTQRAERISIRSSTNGWSSRVGFLVSVSTTEPGRARYPNLSPVYVNCRAITGNPMPATSAGSCTHSPSRPSSTETGCPVSISHAVVGASSIPTT